MKFTTLITGIFSLLALTQIHCSKTPLTLTKLISPRPSFQSQPSMSQPQSQSRPQRQTQDNLLYNGDFSIKNRLASSGRQWIIARELEGWETNEVEIGIGSVYNSRWGNRVVVELDGNQNNYIRQKVDLRNGQGFYVIEIDYAARVGSVDSSKMIIKWNNKIIRSVSAQNQQINKLRLQVQALTGTNVLQIAGDGNSDSYGMTIANVRLYASQELPMLSPSNGNIVGQYVVKTKYKNLFINWDFQNPPPNKNSEINSKILTFLPGWEVKPQIQQGTGSFYNPKWGKKTVIQLDGNQNGIISQRINLAVGKYHFQIDYAPRANHIQTSQLSIFLNDQQITLIKPKTQSIRTFSFNFLVTDPGEFVFELRAQGDSDKYGMTVGAVYLWAVSEAREVLYEAEGVPCFEAGRWE